MNFKKLFFKVLYLFLLSSVYIHAQELPDIIPPSPIARQFHRYSDYPVSHFTGVPEISIPLYSIVEGDLMLPISISYHSSGRKVMDQPGFLGFGWSILAAGRVTQNIESGDRDFAILNLPDEDEMFLHSGAEYLRKFVARYPNNTQG